MDKCSDTLLQHHGLGHHGDASDRRLQAVNFNSISTNKERLANTFPGYHSRYHNLFRKFVSFVVQAFQLHIFLGTIETNSIVLKRNVLEGKSPSHLETRAVVKNGSKCWIHLRCFQTFVAMKILFLDQAMDWWFAERYPRCNFPDGIVGTRFIFLRTNKLLKNRCVFFCCCGNGSAASFTTLCRSSLLDFFDYNMNCHAGTFDTWMLFPDFVYVSTLFIKIIFNDSLFFIG